MRVIGTERAAAGSDGPARLAGSGRVWVWGRGGVERPENHCGPRGRTGSWAQRGPGLRARRRVCGSPSASLPGPLLTVRVLSAVMKPAGRVPADGILMCSFPEAEFDPNLCIVITCCGRCEINAFEIQMKSRCGHFKGQLFPQLKGTPLSFAYYRCKERERVCPPPIKSLIGGFSF